MVYFVRILTTLALFLATSFLFAKLTHVERRQKEKQRLKTVVVQTPEAKMDYVPFESDVQEVTGSSGGFVDNIAATSVSSFDSPISLSSASIADFSGGKMRYSGMGAQKKDLQPVYRTSPMYPNQALVRKIEGHVLLKVDITKEGKVENIRIVESVPARVFDRSAVRAVSSWKFPDSSKPIMLIPMQKYKN